MAKNEFVNKLWDVLARSGFSVDAFKQQHRMEIEELSAVLDDLNSGTPQGKVPAYMKTTRRITMGRSRFLLSAHESSAERGWWGLTAKALNKLESQNLPWVIVLLHGSETAGYWLERSDVERVSKNWSRTTNRDRDYEINAKAGVDLGRRFFSPENLVDLVRDFANRNTT